MMIYKLSRPAKDGSAMVLYVKDVSLVYSALKRLAQAYGIDELKRVSLEQIPVVF